MCWRVWCSIIGKSYLTFNNIQLLFYLFYRENTIELACAEFVPVRGESHLEAFARYFRLLVTNDGSSCLANYQATVEAYRNTSQSSAAVQSAGRQWLYQTCTEFGWYQTSGSIHQPFGSSFPVEFNTQLCSDLFSDNLTLTHDFIHGLIDRKNVIFGGWNSAVQNVYFTNGLVDPWRTMGIQQDLNPSSPADIIPGASHCNDLSSISENDSSIMLAVKRRIRRLFANWLEIEVV